LAGLERLHAEDAVHRLAVNGLRVVRGHFLDVHAALRGGHDHVHAAAAVERDAEVELLVDIQRFFDQHLPDDLPRGAGLVRDQVHADDLLRQRDRLVRVLGELDAAALAAAAGVDLGLDDDASAEVLRRLARLLGGVDDDAPGRRHAVTAHDLFCLIFVDFHSGGRFITRRRRAPLRARDAA
jgi:hypothetical protein